MVGLRQPWKVAQIVQMLCSCRMSINLSGFAPTQGVSLTMPASKLSFNEQVRTAAQLVSRTRIFLTCGGTTKEMKPDLAS